MTVQDESPSVESEKAKTNAKKEKKISLAKNISFAGIFAALCYVSTSFFTITLPVAGYFNLGDVFVLLSGWFLGPLYGVAAAGIGSMLADVTAGYASYAPATFVIKALDAFIAYMVWSLLKKCIRGEKLDFLPRIVSAVAGEALMVLGYFFFEAVFMGLGAGAAGNIFGNTMQGLAGIICSTVLVGALYPVKPVKNFFPKLNGSK